jgi:hypothetical protein
MLDRLKPEIDIEVGPVEVPWAGLFDIEERGGGCVPEPRELAVRQIQLARRRKQPGPMFRYIDYFNR